MKVASMFCGIGGIDLGFQQAGFDVVWANEKDAAACRTYRYNFGSDYLIEGDIRKVDVNTIPQVDVLAAGFPCQSFSVAGKQKGFGDARGQLFFEVVRVIEAIQPPVIFLENVENLMEHDNGRTFQVIYTSLVGLGYILRYQPMATHEYVNIPQTRRRIYIVAFRDYEICQRFHYPEPMQRTATIHDFLDTASEQHEIYYFRDDTSYDKYIRENIQDDNCLYRIFNGSITKYASGMCPTLTASMNTLRNAAALRDKWGVRRITLREALRFQGFPQEYYFPNTIQLRDAYKQIGNSVSVPVIQRIAERIKTAMEFS